MKYSEFKIAVSDSGLSACRRVMATIGELIGAVSDVPDEYRAMIGKLIRDTLERSKEKADVVGKLMEEDGVKSFRSKTSEDMILAIAVAVSSIGREAESAFGNDLKDVPTPDELNDMFGG